MGVEIVPAYRFEREVAELFSEYTKRLFADAVGYAVLFAGGGSSVQKIWLL